MIFITPPRFLILPASSFAEQLAYRTSSAIFLDRLTALTFENSPLRGYDAVARSELLVAIARSCDDEVLSPDARVQAVDRQQQPPPEYDWIRTSGGAAPCRVACRGAQLTWNRGNDRWELLFPAINLPPPGMRDDAPFDELWLAAHTPAGIYLYRHDDWVTGVRAHGPSTSDRVIQFVGPRCRAQWGEAFKSMHANKIKACSTLLAFVRNSDELVTRVTAALPRQQTAAAFEGVPLSAASVAARSELLELLVRRIDRGWLHTQARFGEPPWPQSGGDQGATTKRRGKPKPEHTWTRDERRIACRSTQLMWDKTHRFWKLQFTGVRLPLEGVRDEAPFDELLLAAYTPAGIYVHRHDLRTGVARNGKHTATTGHRIRFYGPRGVEEWQPALAAILTKMSAGGCTPLAMVEFEHTDEEVAGEGTERHQQKGGEQPG